MRIIGRCPKCGHPLSAEDVGLPEEEGAKRVGRLGRWREELDDAALGVGWLALIPVLVLAGIVVIAVLAIVVAVLAPVLSQLLHGG